MHTQLNDWILTQSRQSTLWKLWFIYILPLVHFLGTFCQTIQLCCCVLSNFPLGLNVSSVFFTLVFSLDSYTATDKSANIEKQTRQNSLAAFHLKSKHNYSPTAMKTIGNSFNEQSVTVFACNIKLLHRKNNFTFKLTPPPQFNFGNCISCVYHLKHLRRFIIFDFDYIFSGIHLIFVAFNPIKTIIKFEWNLIYEFEKKCLKNSNWIVTWQNALVAAIYLNRAFNRNKNEDEKKCWYARGLKNKRICLMI